MPDRGGHTLTANELHLCKLCCILIDRLEGQTELTDDEQKFLRDPQGKSDLVFITPAVRFTLDGFSYQHRPSGKFYVRTSNCTLPEPSDVIL